MEWGVWTKEHKANEDIMEARLQIIERLAVDAAANKIHDSSFLENLGLKVLIFFFNGGLWSKMKKMWFIIYNDSEEYYLRLDVIVPNSTY